MLRHTVQIVAITIIALACMFYPFIPGVHDRLAVTLSVMAQLLGMTGLLLVPIGVVWLIYELAKRSTRAAPQLGSAPRTDKSVYFAIVGLAASLVVALVVALGALTSTGASLALVVLIVWSCIVWRVAGVLKRMRHKESGLSRLNPVPVYLIVVPVILVIAQLMLMKTAVEFSRHRAMTGASEFIRAIQTYRASHGHFPLSVASVHHDYDPPIVGIEQYQYEPYGRAYNVFFEQFTYRLPPGTQEFVMYNPLDEHAMIVHNQDTLESPQQQVNDEREFHSRTAHDAGVPHWKYFWFD